MAQKPLVDHDLIVIEASQSHFRHTTLGRTPLDEWSARRRDLYLTTLNTYKRQTSMPPGGIRTHNPSKRTAVHPYLRPLGLLTLEDGTDTLSRNVGKQLSQDAA
jgi:hypothetical protein